MTKLTPSKVEQIRALYKKTGKKSNIKELVKKFQISERNIRTILSGKTWQKDKYGFYFREGISKLQECKIWRDMIRRCYDKKVVGYKHYGAKGIGVSKEWKDSFPQFLKDMGSRPSKKHSLDRIDNTKGYSKENCKWSTVYEQQRNKTNNVYLTYNGKTMIQNDWAKFLGISQSAFVTRVKNWKDKDKIFSSKKYKGGGPGGIKHHDLVLTEKIILAVENMINKNVKRSQILKTCKISKTSFYRIKNKTSWWHKKKMKPSKALERLRKWSEGG